MISIDKTHQWLPVETPIIAIRVQQAAKTAFYAKQMEKTWLHAGYAKIIAQNACIPETIVERRELTFTTCNTRKYARLGVTKQFAATERACWYSHFDAWRAVAAVSEQCVITEHDAIYASDSLLKVKGDVTFHDLSAMGAYTLTPAAAAYLCAAVRRRSIDCGPYAMIEALLRDHAKLTLCNHISPVFEPQVCQLYDQRVGTTVDHYDNVADDAMRKRLSEASRTNPSLLCVPDVDRLTSGQLVQRALLHVRAVRDRGATRQAALHPAKA